jgi:hypothetical protein
MIIFLYLHLDMEKDEIASAVWDEFKVGIEKDEDGIYFVNSGANRATAGEIRKFISDRFPDNEVKISPNSI